MDILGPPAFFSGDLGDPWVLAIAEALPREAIRADGAGDWPAAWPPAALSAGVVVLHRPTLSAYHAGLLRALRERDGAPPKVVLCVGPHVRAVELERWGHLADVLLHEATAVEVVARHVRETPPATCQGLRVAVVSGLFETRKVLAEACDAAGCSARPVRGWEEAADADLAVWDVPVLEDGWDRELAAQAARRPVVALLGFADRTTVALARKAGASACLELPCDLDDLAFVLGRVARRPPADVPHAVPPPPMGRKVATSGSRPPSRGIK